MSFWVASTSTLWGPGVAVGLVVLAIAQMGVHLVFFLHITSGPDNTNNVLALAFGVLIVFLVMVGTIWIMAHMDANMAPSPELMNLQMQHELEPKPRKPIVDRSASDARAIAITADRPLRPRIGKGDPDLHRHVGDDRPGDRHRREQRRNRPSAGRPPR